MANGNAFTVYIYENEYEYLKWLVLQKKDIETGGDLFGVWQSEFAVVVQIVLGPGAKCRRTATSFFQDVDYLKNVGHYLTSNEGICNIGEWHSHHRLGLAYPSDGDQRTVWENMPTVSGGRFLVFIANIENNRNAKVGCFMFNSATRKMTKGTLKLLMNCSPIRHTFSRKQQFKHEAEPRQNWETFFVSKLNKAHRGRGNKVGDGDLESVTTGEFCVCDVKDRHDETCNCDSCCECCGCCEWVVHHLDNCIDHCRNQWHCDCLDDGCDCDCRRCDCVTGIRRCFRALSSLWFRIGVYVVRSFIGCLTRLFGKKGGDGRRTTFED